MAVRIKKELLENPQNKTALEKAIDNIASEAWKAQTGNNTAAQRDANIMNALNEFSGGTLSEYFSKGNTTPTSAMVPSPEQLAKLGNPSYSASYTPTESEKARYDAQRKGLPQWKQDQIDDLLGVERPKNGSDSAEGTISDEAETSTGTGNPVDLDKVYNNPYSSIVSAQNYINEQLAKLDNKTPYSDQLGQLINDYMNRDKFSYDPNADMLYQNYLAAMQNAGQLAMKDTLGQAAGLTGGYGSSYATAAANGAYNNYIQQANQALPDYYNMAREAYADESNQALQNIKLLQDQDEDYYNRYVNNLKLGMQRENDLYNRYMASVSGAEEKPYTNIQYRDIYKDILSAYEEGGEDAALTAALAYKYLPDEDMENLLEQVKDYSNLNFTMTKDPIGNSKNEYTDQNGKVWTYEELKKLHEQGLISDRKWADIDSLTKKGQSTYKK